MKNILKSVAIVLSFITLGFAQDKKQNGIFAEINTTKGKIEARLKMTDLAISSLEKASQLGKPLHLCELQKAHAYLLKEIPDLKNAKSSYHEAGKDIPKDTYYAKFNSELEHVNRKIRKMEMQF